MQDQLLGKCGQKMEKGRVAMATVSHANQAREWANSLLDGCDGFDPETAQAISEKSSAQTCPANAASILTLGISVAPIVLTLSIPRCPAVYLSSRGPFAF